MKNKILTIFSIFFLLGSSSINAQSSDLYGANYYCPNLTEANKQTTLAEIRDFCTNRFAIEDMNYVMSSISDLFDDLLITEINDVDCNRGNLKLTGYEQDLSSSTSDWSTTLNFRWGESALVNINFYKAYLDLLSVTLEGETKIDAETGAHLVVPGTTRGKIFILNARCGQKQSGYYIIIVDRDIELLTLPESENRMLQAENIAETRLQVFPNPLLNTQGQVAFYLPENQSATLSIFDGRGKLIQTVFSNKELEKGNHTQTMEISYLPVGVYHIVLQTGKDRVVTKMIKA